MVRTKHDLIAGHEQSLLNPVPIDHRAAASSQIHQSDSVGMRLQTGMSIGDIRLVDTNLGVDRAADGAGNIKVEAPPVVRSTQRTQHHPPLRQIRCRRLRNRNRLRSGTHQQQIHPIHMQCIAGAQHGHSPDPATVDVQTVRLLPHLQPDATAIHRYLQLYIMGLIDQTWPAVDILADRVHARSKHQIVTLTVGELQSKGIHSGKI